MDVLWHSICSKTAQHALPRGPTRFVNNRQEYDWVSESFWLRTLELCDLNPIYTSWSAFHYYFQHRTKPKVYMWMTLDAPCTISHVALLRL